MQFSGVTEVEFTWPNHRLAHAQVWEGLGVPSVSSRKDGCRFTPSNESNHDRWPQELLHMDMVGPSRVRSLGGKWYVLVIVDDFSRYSWVFFMETKDEAFSHASALILRLKSEFPKGVMQVLVFINVITISGVSLIVMAPWAKSDIAQISLSWVELISPWYAQR